LAESDAANYLGVVAANADFNDDGFVDMGDFIVWAKSNGLTVPAGTLGDANYDTLVNDDDYTIWQQQFGTSPGSGGGAVGALAVQYTSASDTSSDDPQAVVIEDSTSDAESKDIVFNEPPNVNLARVQIRPRSKDGVRLDFANRGDRELLSVFLAERCAQLDTTDDLSSDHNVNDRAIEVMSNAGELIDIRIPLSVRECRLLAGLISR
jgi:hypothetical protein